jgi:tRNA (guanine-N7-)-methyltransferase
MLANSRLPRSAQTAIHPQLLHLLARHTAAPFRKPYADYNRAAFAASLERRQRLAPNAPLILDAGCGVGASSIALARAFPEHYVIGVDQSAVRLAHGKAAHLPPNLDLVRADLADYWRLLNDAQIRLDRHYLLYPNPWPKIGHLSRRWHGHPVFPALLALGGLLDCRSNWPIYVEEFCRATESAAQRPARCQAYLPDTPLTPFERKYQASGHPLFRAVIDLG